MKIKFYDIKNSEDSLEKLMKQDLIFDGYVWKLHKNIKEINEALLFLNEKREKLVEKYGEINDKNETHVKEENKDIFLKEYKDVLDTEFDLNIEKIPISLLEKSNVKLSPYDISNLEFIFDYTI